MVTREPQPPLITRPFLNLTAAHFLQALGYASMPLLPLYLVHTGADPARIGLVMGEAAAGGLLFRPLIGWSLDALGRRITLVFGTLAIAAGTAGIAAVTEVGPLIHALRIVFGIGVGTLFSGYFTFAADVVPTRRRTEGLALFGVSGLAPLAINPLVERLDLDPGQLRWVFPCVALLVLASLIPMWRLPESRGKPPAADVSPRQAFRALRHPHLWPVWAATVVFSGPVAVFLSFATVTAEHRGLANAGVVWLSYVGGAATVRLLGGRVPDRVGPSNMVAPSIACYGVGMLVLAMADATPAFLLAGLLGGVGHGYGFPVLAGQVVTRAPDHLRGTAMAMFTGLFDLTMLTFNPLFGLVALHRDYGTAFAAGALSCVAGLLIWVSLEHWLAGSR